MNANECPFTIEYENDPIKNAEARLQMEQFKRNLDWLQAHAKEAYSHRGKYICIAGQELFVGDTAEEVLARAKAAHPDDWGMHTQFVRKDRGEWIYAS
jgi:hypothetical protein